MNEHNAPIPAHHDNQRVNSSQQHPSESIVPQPEPSSVSSLGGTKRERRSAFILCGALLALAGTLAFQEIRDLDIGFHLKAGGWIIEHLRFPGRDYFTYTVSNTYIDLYWLYQVMLWGIDAVGGEFALVTVNALLVATGVALMMKRTVELGAFASAATGVVLLAGIMAASYQFTIRPHVLSWMFLNLLLLTLERYYRDRSVPLWPLPLVMLLWVNSHTLFILGWVALFCYVAGIAVERRALDRRLTAYAAAAVLICLANPYFLQGVMLPFTQFGFLQQGNAFKELIAEYMSPFTAYSFDRYIVNRSFVLVQPVFFFHLFVALAIAGFAGKLVVDRGRRVHEILLTLLFAYILLSAFKNIGYFVFAMAPFTARGLWLLRRMVAGRKRPPAGAAADIAPDVSVDRAVVTAGVTASRPVGDRRGIVIVNALLAVVTIALGLRVATNAYYIAYRGLEETGYRYSPYKAPIAATEFVRDHGLRGRLLNHFNFGGVLMNMLPQQVFIDARNEVIGEEFFNEYRKMFNDAGRDYLLRKYSPDIVMFPYAAAPKWQEYFNRRADWRLVFVDGCAAVYLRNGYADTIPAMQPFAVLAGIPQKPLVRIDALIDRREFDGTFAGYVRRQYYPRVENDLCNFCLLNGWLDAAVQIAAEGAARSTVFAPEIYHRLGTAFRFKKDFARSIRCYRRYLEQVHDPKVEQLVREMESRNSGGEDAG